jgi:hypothetical protein
MVVVVVVVVVVMVFRTNERWYRWLHAVFGVGWQIYDG